MQGLFENIEQNVIKWGNDRNLLDADNAQKQLLKTMAELGELADAELKKDHKEIKDGIGDVIVTLTMVANINNLNLTECYKHSYEEIRNRTGKTVGGTFIKD